MAPTAIEYTFSTDAHPTYLAADVLYGTAFHAPDSTVQGVQAGIFYADWFRNDPLGHACVFHFKVADFKSFNLLSVSFQYTSPSTGPSSFNIHYSDNGLNWTPIAAAADPPLVRDGTAHTVKLALPGISSAMTGAVYIEIYGYGASDPGALWRLDNVQVHGTFGGPVVWMLEPRHVALRHSSGIAGYWEFEGFGNVHWAPLTMPGPDWRIRGIQDNRVLLQDGDGGRIGYWDYNDDPMTWHQISGPVPGIVARDLYWPFVLLQAGDGGQIGLWKLNAAGQVAQWIPMAGPMPGWIARALWDDLVLLQQGTGGPAGFWHLTASYQPYRWTRINGPMPGWVIRDFIEDRILLQQGEGGVSGYWHIRDGLPYRTWQQIAPPMPGWTIGPFQ